MLEQLLRSGRITKYEAIQLFEEYSNMLSTEYNVSDIPEDVIGGYIADTLENC